MGENVFKVYQLGYFAFKTMSNVDLWSNAISNYWLLLKMLTYDAKAFVNWGLKPAKKIRDEQNPW